jgi:UDP-N-acetylglucosamine 4-epimerase
MRLNPDLKNFIFRRRYKWLITGVAGFIGSNLLEFLLKANQQVIGIDNLSTGSKVNLENVRLLVDKNQWIGFTFIEGDIRDKSLCARITVGVDFVLHQAALGSVPRSIEDPLTTNDVNVSGFLNVIVASKKANVKKFIYAASSSTYGDSKVLPKVEENIGAPLSPYAVTKYANELYANVFNTAGSFQCVGLRYFNVFGPRQDPNGAYAAVIPKWINLMLNNEIVTIYGCGNTSRDFCFIDNVIQANILAALNNNLNGEHEVLNIAGGQQTTLIELFDDIKTILANKKRVYEYSPIFLDYRDGDVLHSLADISKAKKMFGYKPSHKFSDGLEIAIDWYIKNLDR